MHTELRRSLVKVQQCAQRCTLSWAGPRLRGGGGGRGGRGGGGGQLAEEEEEKEENSSDKI